MRCWDSVRGRRATVVISHPVLRLEKKGCQRGVHAVLPRRVWKVYPKVSKIIIFLGVSRKKIIPEHLQRD